MKNQDVEKKIKNAYSKIEVPNVLNSVLSDCETQKGIVYMEKRNNSWKKGLAFACAAVLVFTGIAGYNSMVNANKVVSTVAFDVNPSIELEMNKKEEVVKVNALNDDAKKVLDGMDLEGSDLDVAVNALIGSMIKQGYLSDLANSILVSVKSNDQATTDKLQKELMEEINELIRENNLDGAVLSQKINLDDEEIEELAQVYGITKGKTQLIKEILKTNPYHSFEDLVDLSINELNLISKPTQESMSNVSSTGSASDKKYIGAEKAKEIAFANVKAKESQVTELEVDLDYEMGTMVYEVDFEFNNVDYDFDIKAVDGEILHVHKEAEQVRDNTPVTQANPSSYIGNAKAKEIALAHAKVSESEISGFWIEMDKDDGQVIYEIEFNVGKKEYDYDIKAVDGTILKSEVDVEDDDDDDDDKVITNNTNNNTSNNNTSNNTTNPSTTLISKTRAKEIALANANVSASQISDYEIELDDDDGKKVYEISFNVGTSEYDYEINAVSGAIIQAEKDIDD